MPEAKTRDHEALIRENEALRARLEEAEDALRAIRGGEADAVVVAGPSGPKVFTLRGVDQPYRLLVEGMKEGAVTLSPDGTILYANRRFAEMLGLPLANVIAASLPSFVLPADRMVLEALLRQGRFSGAEAEVSLVGETGATVPVYLAASPFRAERGEALCLVVTDLTEQKRSQAIIADQRLARTILDQAGEAIVVCDETGQVIRANQAAHRLCGRNPLLQPFEAAFPLRRGSGAGRRGESAGEVFRLAPATRGEALRGVELELSQDGLDPSTLLLSAGPLLDGEGRTLGWVVTLTDITARQAAEQEIRRLNQDLNRRVGELQTLLDILPVGICVAHDSQARHMSINPAGARMLGISLEANPSKTGPEAERLSFKVRQNGREVPPEELPIQTAVAHDMAIRDAEYEVLHADGTVVNLLEYASPLHDEQGRVRGGLGVFVDITARKRAEAALRASEETSRRRRDEIEGIYRNAPVGLGVLDTDLRFVRINERLAEFNGFAPAEHLGKTVREIVPQAADEAEPLLRRVLETGEPLLGLELTAETAARPGVLRTWVEHWMPLKDADGKVVGINVVTEEVTERRRAEAELAAEKERLAVTLRSIADGVVTTDVEGRVVLLNPVAERLTGWSQAEAAGRPLGDVFCIVDETTRAAADNPVYRTLLTGESVNLASGHGVLIARDGTERVIVDSAAPIHAPDGRVLGAVLVFGDMTERRRIEQELAKAGKLESIGVLAGGIAHDFNNILTAIMANLSLAKLAVPPGDKLHQRLAEAEKASLRARDLTQQLLTFAKGGAPIRKPTTLGGLLRESTEFSLAGTNVRAEFDIPDDLWPAEVDEGQISQVIQNLVLNARQAMPGGGVVRARAEGVVVTPECGLPLAEGRYLRLSIRDQGPGIPEDHLPKVFDPFFTTKPQGSGLGLATAYSIVRQHDGHLSVESKVGEGSTFYIYLPALWQEGAVGPGREAKRVWFGQGRLLVMDDEPAMRETAWQVLTALGYEVTLAADGREAVDLYRRAMAAGTPFRAAILDLTVPGGLGGRETLRQLLAVDPQVRAIVSSGYSNDPVMSDFSSHGFRGVVAKPYSVEELSHVVHSVIRDP